jgi:hypothetical protein
MTYYKYFKYKVTPEVIANALQHNTPNFYMYFEEPDKKVYINRFVSGNPKKNDTVSLRFFKAIHKSKQVRQRGMTIYQSWVEYIPSCDHIGIIVYVHQDKEGGFCVVTTNFWRNIFIYWLIPSNIMTYSFIERLAGVPALKQEIKTLEQELEDSDIELRNKQYLIDALKQDVEVWRDTASDYLEQIDFWKEMLYHSLEVPDISNIIKDQHTVVNLYDHMDKFKDLPMGATIVDEYYHLYPYAVWEDILALVQSETKEEIGRWRTDVSDCDDFATIMRAAMALSFIDARSKYQGAFSWARSRGHAYNAFVDDALNIWIFEPQNGAIIGKLYETDNPWDTIHLRF